VHRGRHQPLPPVWNWRVAAANGTLLFENKASNEAMKFRAVLGDAAAAFNNAPYTRRESFSTQPHTALTMEPRGLLCEWDSARGKLTVSGAAKVCSQSPHHRKSSAWRRTRSTWSSTTSAAVLAPAASSIRKISSFRSPRATSDAR